MSTSLSISAPDLQTCRRSRRSALTLIELLVVIGILALLMALLLPAVQAAREAAHRTKCQSNLRQLALATLHYESTFALLPSGTVPNTDLSAHAKLLPFLEQGELFNALNVSLRGGTAANYTVRISQLEILLCPSDRSLGLTFNSAWVNYPANSGRGSGWFGDNGPFRTNGTWIALSDFRRGTSHVVLFSEWVLGEPFSHEPRGGVFELPPPPATTLDSFVHRCNSELDYTSQGVSKGMFWLTGVMGNTLYNHVLGPNGPSCSFPGSGFQTAYTASSRHRGGVHAAAADGSTQFVNDTIDLSVWRGLATLNEF